MFILTTVTDLVQIIPQDFQKPSAESIEDNINTKYSNRILPRIGLCICLYDILSASDGLIGHGTGIANVNVEFRLIVFRPFKGEIIVGRIASSSEMGIRIALDFFDDVYVPPDLLFEGSTFDHEEQLYVWRNNGHDYHYDRNEWVRVRVESEHWEDLKPTFSTEASDNEETKSRCAYKITASMQQSGLGSIHWW